MELCQQPALLNPNPLKELWKGSEYPVVVLLFPQHYLMLSRNLLYTGLTPTGELGRFDIPKYLFKWSLLADIPAMRSLRGGEALNPINLLAQLRCH